MGIDYIHSFLQPWVKHDMRLMLREPDIAAVRAGKYISMHVRRTDKLVYNEAKKTETVVRSVVACLANSDAFTQQSHHLSFADAYAPNACSPIVVVVGTSLKPEHLPSALRLQRNPRGRVAGLFRKVAQATVLVLMGREPPIFPIFARPEVRLHLFYGLRLTRLVRRFHHETPPPLPTARTSASSPFAGYSMSDVGMQSSMV